MVVVTDDHDRENEGDLVLAACHATPTDLAFMIRHTSGIVCAPITAENAGRLRVRTLSNSAGRGCCVALRSSISVVDQTA